MEKVLKRGWGRTLLVMGATVSIGCLLAWIFIFEPSVKPWWSTLSRPVRGGISAEENRIREEVILKKMEEASLRQDWKDLAPEYPRPRKLDPAGQKDRIKALKGSPEYKEMDKEVKDYLRHPIILRVIMLRMQNTNFL